MTSPALETLHLTKRFGAMTAVDDLTLRVDAGEIFGFLGPNGAGKTTAIRMMVGLLRPSAGQVSIDGLPIDDGCRAGRIGLCPQETILWDKLTCLDQLEFMGEMYSVPRRIARQRGTKLLEELGLTAKAGELASRLSGGMKRRLNLALALVHDPSLVVLDEPEAGLDPQSRALVRDYIRGLARRKTVILTTHDMDEAERLADRVAIIDHGRLLVIDTPDGLKRSMGDGDVCEIKLCDELSGPRATEAARDLFSEVSLGGGVLRVHGKGAVERLPVLLQRLQTAHISTGEVRMRPATLEDVFLTLTGRSLRE
jgi:ABC-2 type transport system ATP-binding protein